MGARWRSLALAGALLAGLAGLPACGANVAPTADALPPKPAAPPSTAPTTPFSYSSSPWTLHSANTDGDPQPRPAWVSVPVLTVWNDPALVRTIDAPILGTEPLVSQWIATMSLAQKLDLDQRVATQALLDDPLTVIGLSGEWAHVLVDDQTGSVYPDGIEGWVPRSQISFNPLRNTSTSADVVHPVASAGDLRLSYGTRLPVAGTTSDSLVVATTAGLLSVPKASVHVGPLPASGEAVLRQAEQFLGLPYLWAGTSAYGFDCSGLTYTVYRQFGITLARDAADQAQQGVPVQRHQLQSGDLVFFAAGGVIHHVAIYAGNGLMLDAPETGSRVELVPLWGTPLSVQYAGARRYLS